MTALLTRLVNGWPLDRFDVANAHDYGRHQRQIDRKKMVGARPIG
jgi:hypothetical protein